MQMLKAMTKGEFSLHLTSVPPQSCQEANLHDRACALLSASKAFLFVLLWEGQVMTEDRAFFVMVP